MDFFREVLERGDRLGDGFFQLLGRREIGVAQPVVAYHAALVGVGDGTGLDGDHVGEGFGNFRRECFNVAWLDVHQGEIE